MTLPLIVSFWMRAVLTFVDTIYAAYLGDSAVAAIGLAVPFEFLMISLWVGMSTGLTSNLSRAMGAKSGRRIDQYVKIAMGWVFIAVPFFLLVGAGIWFWAPTMNVAQDVRDGFQIYGTVIVAGSALTTFWSVIPDSLVKAHQDTDSTMWAGIVSNVINFALNTLFLFVLGWGLFGIALSTVIGRLGGLAYALWRSNQHERQRRKEWGETTEDLDPRPTMAMLGLAVPAAMTFALMSTETAVVNWILARLPNSTEALAAYSIYYRVVLFLLNPLIATSVAMLPFAARKFGRGDMAGVRRSLRDASLAAAAYSVLAVAPLLYFAGPSIAAFLAESEVTARYTAVALNLASIACLFSIPGMLCRPVFEAMQRGRPGLIMALIRYVVLTIPLIFAGMWIADHYQFDTLYGVILGLIAASLISSVWFWIWLQVALAKQSAVMSNQELQEVT